MSFCSAILYSELVVVVKDSQPRSLRAEQADLKRQRIVEAASRLFAAHGFQATTMAAVAREARVAIQTLYSAFASKRDLAVAVADRAIIVSDVRRLSAELEAERPPAEQLRIAAAIQRRASEALADYFDLFSGPDAGFIRDTDLSIKGPSIRRVIEQFARGGKLRPGLDQQRAGDIAIAMASFDIYRVLVRHFGWTPEAYEEWQAQHWARELLG